MKGYDTPIPELGNRTWRELETIEDPDGGHLLFSDQLRQRGKDDWIAVPVLVRVTRPIDSIKARAEARALAVQNQIDEKSDGDVFAEIEQLCLLARALRDPKTRAQLATAAELASDYDEGSLHDVLGRIQVYKSLLDPRETQLTDDQVVEKVVAVARRGHLGPLTDIAGHEQPSFVVSMARLALTSPTVQSWLQSQGTSTPAPSASQS